MILERGLGRAVQCMSKKLCKEKVVTFFTKNGNLFGNLLLNKKACKFKTYRLIIVLEADRTGLEPATSAVTGRHSNQLNYRSNLFFIAFDFKGRTNKNIFKTSFYSQFQDGKDKGSHFFQTKLFSKKFETVILPPSINFAYASIPQ
jgi:hypothetical protein